MARPFRDRIPERYALAIAGTYLVLGVLYIAFSDAVVARLSSSVEQLQRIEMLKGWGYIVTTALGLYLFSRALFRRFASYEEERARQREAFHLLDRRALAGALASTVAHDSNNLLTLARLTTGELLEHPDDEVRRTAAEIDHSIDRLEGMMKRLRDLGSHARAAEVRDVDVVAEIDTCLARTRRHARVRECRLATRGETTLTMRLRPVLVDEIVTNLVLNAAEAGARTIEVAVERSGADACISVSDDGPGIPGELREKVFEPFFTTKTEGTGLGLLSVRACAEAHGGNVRVDASDLGGARFVVTLHPAG